MAVHSIDDVEVIELENTNKYFIVDQRYRDGNLFGQTVTEGFSYALIHSGTTQSWQKVIYDVTFFIERWARAPEFMFIIEARNRGQVKDYLVYQRHIVTSFGGKMHWPDVVDYQVTIVPPAPNRRNDVNKDALIKQEKTRIKQAKAKIKAIQAIPDEPLPINDGPCVIQFQKRFAKGGRVYDYAAIKAGGGLWYTTGPQSTKGYTWDQLIRWIYDGQFGNDWSTVDGLWVASEFVPVI